MNSGRKAARVRESNKPDRSLDPVVLCFLRSSAVKPPATRLAHRRFRPLYGAFSATTPMLAMLSPLFMEGTEQMCKTIPATGERAV